MTQSTPKDVPSAPSTVPNTVIIIGAGVFGLSTALAIAKRYPSTAITVVDRLTPPVPDGTSVDTTRCVRSGKTSAPKGDYHESGSMRRSPLTHIKITLTLYTGG